MSVAAMSSALPGMLHAGQKAAPSKTKRPGKKRHEALMHRGRFWAEIQKNKTMERLFEQYDVSKTGYLSMGEVAKFLQDAAKGSTPTEEEVNFVIRTTHDKSGAEGKGMTMSEMRTALDVWRSWEQVKPEIQMYFEKYDTNNSGKLELDQLKLLLTDLNDGTPPTDDEAKWVLQTVDGALEGVDATGGVNKTELNGAIALWYTHVEDASETPGGNAPAKVGQEGSACCMIS